MKPRTVLYVVVLIIALVFVLANWKLLATPTELSLIVTTVKAPGAIVGLLVVAVVLLIDWGTHALSRRGWERERRQMLQEIERLRTQAHDAESSRLQALQETVQRETSVIREQLARLLESRPGAADTAPKL